MINISSDFVADAMRAHLDCNPRRSIGREVINELAKALQNLAASDRAQSIKTTQPIQQ